MVKVVMEPSKDPSNIFFRLVFLLRRIAILHRSMESKPKLIIKIKSIYIFIKSPKIL